MEELSDPSWKVALLLQLSAGGSLLLSGDMAGRWREPLEARGYRVSMAENSKELSASRGMCDAVLHFQISEQNPSVPLSSLLRAMGPRGQFLGLFRHRVTLFRGIRHSVRNLFSRDGVLQWRCGRQLGLAGIGAAEFWLPLPNLPNLEEFSSADSAEEIEASLGRGRLYSAFFRHCSDGLGIYAARSEQSGFRTLLEHVATGCRNLGIEVGSLRMTRFDLRARGALVTILRSNGLPQELVCRFAHGTDAQRRLQRHWDMEHGVRADLSRIGMDRTIPGTVARFDLGEDQCWIEQRVNGTISWRLPQRHRSRLDSQLLGFLDALAQLAGEERLAAAKEIEEQLDDSSGAVLRPSHGLDDALGALRNHLAAALRSQPFRYGWTHGDFGYGNAVASPSDGRLEAVIDWETASRKALIGIDLFNFLIQRGLEQTSYNLQESISKLIARIDGDWTGERDAVMMPFLARYLPRPTQQLTCLGATLHRWVRRECRNASASKWSHDQLVAAVNGFMQRAQVS